MTSDIHDAMEQLAGPFHQHFARPRHLRGQAVLLESARTRTLIEAAVAHVYGVGIEELRSRSRGKKAVARSRQIAMYLAHVVCGLSLTEVGELFSRDRTTVAHACSVIEDIRDEPVFDETLELLECVIRNILLPRLPGEPMPPRKARLVETHLR